MTEDELATIEARANASKRPCFMCFGMAKTVPTWSACAKCCAAHCGMHERCGDCGSNAPPIEHAPDVVALVAEVRRLTAERDAAFNRGVEAMREACADLCDTRAVEEGSNALQYAANAIRALPLPTGSAAPRLAEDPDPSAAVGTLDAYLAVMDADRCATCKRDRDVCICAPLTPEAPYG